MASYVFCFKLTMVLVVVVVILLGGLSAATARTLRDQLSGVKCGGRSHELSIVERHEQWMARFGRTCKDEAEKAKRFQIFKEEFELVESFNKAGNHGFTIGLNQFSDLTTDEFGAMMMNHNLQAIEDQLSRKKFVFSSAQMLELCREGARHFSDKKFLCLVFGVLLVWLIIYRS